MIGGNTTAQIQVKTTEKNEISERVSTWTPVQSLVGWLDYSGGDSKRQSYDTKLQESSHVFMCDYVPLDATIKTANSRIVIDNKNYDVLVYDNPMNMNQQWEIFLRYVGE